MTAVLMYALRCLAEGDRAALRNMNFGPREIEAAGHDPGGPLPGGVAARPLSAYSSRPPVFWPMLDNLQRQRQSKTQHRLIAAMPRWR